MVRWWWFGPAVEKPELLRELKQMKADGIGGVELAFVYPQTVDNNVPFLSPPMLDAVRYAKTEARRLGLRVDVTLCSGWPYGGPHIPLEQAATRLKTLEVALPEGLTVIPHPALEPGDTLIAEAIVPGTPKHWTSGPDPKTGPRTGLLFLQSHTRQQVKRAAVGAEGFVLDPFSKEAVQNHLHAVGDPLLSAFGKTPPYAIFSDSLEAYGADWTPNLPEEFLKRRGYDLLPRLPELVAGGTPSAEKLRHDYGRTLTELVDENYLAQINQWAIKHHTKFRSQTYGEPAVSFSSQRLATLPEGEGPQWRAFSTLRWASSANHVFGNAITSGETFTWLHSPVFRATPLDMKAEADIDFLMGENQLIFHGWPYSPPASELPKGDPGWSLYAAAVFNDHNPWHPVMPFITSYIAGVSALLREGEPANQVAILLPTDDAWASFGPGHVTLTGAMQRLVPKEMIAAILSAGYNFDFIDAAAVDSAGLRKYQILVIPPTDRIPAETAHIISNWAGEKKPASGTVICLARCPSLDSRGNANPSLSESFTLSPSITELGGLLAKAAKPDLRLQSTAASSHDQVGFIRRKLHDSDIYFLANTSNQPLDLIADFTTAQDFGEAWSPDSETVYSASASDQPIHLAAYESRIFIFAKKHAVSSLLSSEPIVVSAHRASTTLLDLSRDWRVNFVADHRTIAEPFLSDWRADLRTRNYSGEATYARDFISSVSSNTPVYLEVGGGEALPGGPNSVPDEAALGPDGIPNPSVTRTGPGMHAYYDPPIREGALVTLNGHSAGALWHPPYRLDISKHLKPGRNHIVIHVYNTALNAWSAIPPHDYKPLKKKYGDRFQMQDLDKVERLPSGILGTIHLVLGDER